VARSTDVRVTFSEPMAKPSVEAAFSLSRQSEGARVGGAYSWSGDTLTFRPDAPLDQATDYTARVDTGARDAAGNALSAVETWSFKTLATASAFPSATAIDAGTLRAGTSARLGADDDSYYEVNSTTSGTTTSSWYGRIPGVSNALRSLKLTYRGRSSATCTHTLALYRWTTGGWVSVDSRSVGTTEIQVDKAPTGTLADFVSGTSGVGEVRARVRCVRSSGAFYTRGDLMRVVFEAP
jgi:hypothetical protein